MMLSQKSHEESIKGFAKEHTKDLTQKSSHKHNYIQKKSQQNTERQQTIKNKKDTKNKRAHSHKNSHKNSNNNVKPP